MDYIPWRSVANSHISIRPQPRAVRIEVDNPRFHSRDIEKELFLWAGCEKEMCRSSFDLFEINDKGIRETG